MNLTPKAPRLAVALDSSTPTAQIVARHDHLLVILPHEPDKKTIAAAPFADDIKALRSRALDKDSILQGPLQGGSGAVLTVATMPKTDSAFARLDLCRRALARACSDNPETIAAISVAADADARNATAAAMAAAAFAREMPLPSFKSKPPPSPRFRALTLFGDPQIDLERLRIEAEANNLARWLTALPANVMTARALIRCAADIAARDGFEYKLYDELVLGEMGAGAFLAVAQGNAHSNAGIVHLRRPGRGGPSVALVGKGVCFDTGGINVKPANYMHGMHEDMQGSAVALATFRALATLDSKLELSCWLAVTENRINSDAYTPNEIVTALNGKTIEVIHSDAEGRMALADALVLAAKPRPDLIIDYATLTGSCVTALTSRYSGVFCNRRRLEQLCVEAGRDSGERVWPFPFESDFDAELSSTQADVKQCSLKGGGDHILAARFLAMFVGDDIDWVHVDLSAGNHKGGLAHVPTDNTGFGVRFTTRLVLDSAALAT